MNLKYFAALCALTISCFGASAAQAQDSGYRAVLRCAGFGEETPLYRIERTLPLYACSTAGETVLQTNDCSNPYAILGNGPQGLFAVAGIKMRKFNSQGIANICNATVGLGSPAGDQILGDASSASQNCNDGFLIQMNRAVRITAASARVVPEAPYEMFACQVTITR